MCGISGIFDMKKENRVDKNILDCMTHKLDHRGPDDVGYFLMPNIGLGFTRLSIIDLTTGMQPIYNEDESIILICNGEIFNYMDLREMLLYKGHKFRSNTDVEVLVHLYEEYGVDFLNQINGQFAFTIYDINKNLLFCARDQIGIVPFFYTQVNGIFIFASEIKAILEHPYVRKAVDLTGLDQIVTFPGLIGARTLFKDIESLESGKYILIQNNIKLVEYWDLEYPQIGEINYNENEDFYIETLDDILNKSIQRRLIADVPVGFYLSGGLDSSLIGCKATNYYKNNIKTFSIDFSDQQMSEAEYQTIMSKYINSEHHTKCFDIHDITNRLRKAIYSSECMLKESYNTASHALSEMAHQEGIKVILTGEGADELFGGYVGYKFDKFRNVNNTNNGYEDTKNKELNYNLWGAEDFIYEKNYSDYEKIKNLLYSEKIKEIYDNVNFMNYPILNTKKVKNVDILHRRSYIDFKLRLPDHLLADHGDRMFMANSVEGRYPFLDIELINFTKIIPPHLKLNNFDEKYILKKIGDKILPEEIIKRQKFSFVAPGSTQIIKQDKEYFFDLLSFDRIKRQGYFNPDTVVMLRDKYISQGFELNLPFETDLLIMVITFGIFLDLFNMPNLN